MSHRHEFITVAGCKTEIYRGGQGAPLLFLHGAGGNPDWMPFMAALATDYDVIAPSHPGFGRSEVPDWLDHMGDMALFYLDLLAQLDLSGVHLVGSSLGGWLAAEIAVRDQSRISSLTLVAAAGIQVKGEPMGDVFIWSPEERVRNLFHDRTLAEARLQAPMDDEMQDIALQNNFTTARLAWSPRFHNPDLRKWSHRITVPTLVLWGDDDKVFPEPYAHGWKEVLPQSEVQVFENCGHLPQIEKQHDFVNAVRAFAG